MTRAGPDPLDRSTSQRTTMSTRLAADARALDRRRSHAAHSVVGFVRALADELNAGPRSYVGRKEDRANDPYYPSALHAGDVAAPIHPAPARVAAGDAPPQRRGTRTQWIVLALLVLLRLVWTNAYPFDTDEAQHAHVAWAWTQGLLPYRDVFDNHGPLFGLLHAGIIGLLGERADIQSWLRIAMQAWYLLTLFALWQLGRRLYGTRVAFAAVLLTALYPKFFLVSGQFRTDDLWMCAWVGALAVLACSRPTPRRWFVAGVLAGAALAVSQKTLVLLGGAGVAGAAIALGARSARAAFAWRPIVAAAVGLLLLPAAFALWFGAHDALDRLWYCVVTYNVAPTGELETDQPLKFAVLAALAALAIAWSVRYVRSARDADARWRVFFPLQAGLYLLVIVLVWPLITRQDFLPAIPLLVLALCGSVANLRVLATRPRVTACLAAATVVVELVRLGGSIGHPWDSLRYSRQTRAMILHYSDGDDTVMDAKGETIFRRRASYDVFESLMRSRMRNGLVADTLPESLVGHGTMLVIPRGLPPTSSEFFNRNYLPARGETAIAGRVFDDAQSAQSFDLELPGDYTLTNGTQAIAASLDGRPQDSRWQLGAGPHRLAIPGDGKFALVWTKAWQRGWRPQL